MADKTVSDVHLDFELADHLPYLFKHIHSQLEVASAGQLAQFGINVAVWRILVVLWQHDNLSHRELSDLTSIEASSLSRISKSVQRDGLIRRKRTIQDQRTVRVTLTEKGRDIVKTVVPWALQCQADIVGGLSADDVTNLTRILHTIIQNLNRYAKADIDLECDVPPKLSGTAKVPQTAPRTARTAITRRKRVPVEQ